MDTTIITIVSTVFAALVTGLLTRYYYLKGMKKKIPVYSIDFFNVVSSEKLIKENLEPLKITYGTDYKPVNNLTITKVYIGNMGNTPIIKNDIPENNPFLINVSSDCKVFLEPNCDNEPEKSSASASFYNDSNKIYIDISYIEPKAGFTVNIVHSGNDSDCIDVSGKVIGGKKLKRTVNNYETDIFKELSSPLSTIYMSYLPYFLLLLFVLLISIESISEIDLETVKQLENTSKYEKLLIKLLLGTNILYILLSISRRIWVRTAKWAIYFYTRMK